VRTAAIILAAGASRRMGAPKALLTYDNETFLDRLIRIFTAVCEETIVVLGIHAETIKSSLSRRAHFIVNAEPELGQLSSLQCGLTAMAPDVETVFFTLVDCPTIQPETPASLIAQYQPGTPFVVPRFEGQHGHPVLFEASLAVEFLSLPRDASARDVVHRHAASTQYVDVNDPGILRDIDKPSDYHALIGASTR
jgi:molybdenum cofactor cytidylyltransferase